MTRLYILAGPDKDESFELKGEFSYVGRSPHNNIQTRDIAVSRRHAKISRRANSFFIKDLGSANGTYVSGEQISPGVEVELKEGVPVVIGMSVSYLFSLVGLICAWIYYNKHKKGGSS